MRTVLVAALFLLGVSVVTGQGTGVLRITVTLTDSQGRTTPVPRHALLISDEPPTTVPRRIVTGLDGTATVTLRPGAYIVESDVPVAFEGKSYTWAQPVQVTAGGDVALPLTASNAEAGAITPDTLPMARPSETEPALILQPYQESVVGIWTPTGRASGFVVDPQGFIATGERAIGNASTVEVQLSNTVKIQGRVVASDRTKNVAVVRVAPGEVAAVKPVVLQCASHAAIGFGQTIYTIGFAPPQPRSLTSGEVRRAEGRFVTTDLIVPEATVGGPVFTPTGSWVGLTSMDEDPDGRSRESVRVVTAGDSCELITSATQKRSIEPPSPAHLPIEPDRPFPTAALKNVKRAAAVPPEYMTSSADFDIAFITPVLVAAAQRQQEEIGSREARVGARIVNPQSPAERALGDFGKWAEYVAATPPVLIVRATPRLVEGFWTKVARGAAMTQGAYIPSLKHFKTGFSSMRALCGDREVTPVHPFVIEHQVSETESIDEGFYVFQPDALGPHCGTVKLTLYSEKAPDKGETRTIDPKTIDRAWQDFEAWR